MADTLPPVVARLIADTSDFVDKMVAAAAVARTSMDEISGSADRTLPRFTGDLSGAADELPKFTGSLDDATKRLPRFTGELDRVGGGLDRLAVHAEHGTSRVRRAFDHMAAGSAGKLVSSMGRGISDVVSLLGRGVSQMGSTMASGASQMGAMLAKVPWALVAALAAAAIAAVAIMQPLGVLLGGVLIGGIGAGIAAVPIIFAAKNKQVAKDWKSTIDHMKSVITGLAQPFVPVLEHISSMVRKAFDAMAPTFGAAFKQIAPHIQSFAGNLIKAFQQLAPAVKPVMKAFGDILDQIGPMLPGIFREIATAVSNLAKNISKHKKEFAQLIEFFIEIIPKAIEFINWMINAGDAIYKFASGIVKWLKDAWKHVGQFFKDWDNVLKGFVGGVWKAIKSVGKFFSGLWKTIVGAFAGAATWLIGKGVAIIDGLRRGITSAWRSVTGWLGRVWRSITGFFAGAGRWLWNAGAAVINGLVAGFEAAWHAVSGWLSSVAGWIANLKGPIEYDRTLLVPHGKAIMAGLLEGLQHGGVGVQDYLKGFTATIAGGGINGHLSVSGSAAALTATSTRALPAGVTVYVAGNVTTERNLITAIQQGMLQVGARRPVTYQPGRR